MNTPRVTLVAFVVMVWCTVGPSAASAAGNAGSVAKRLTEAATLQEAVSATERALALGGVATVSEGEVAVLAIAPAAPVVSSGTEILEMAFEAQQRQTMGRLTLAELGARLRALRFPFRRRGNAGSQLVTFLKTWVKAARRKPAATRSFTPLFLAEMAKRQSPPVNLAKGNYQPRQLRLTLLDLQLIGAAFQRSPRSFWRAPSRAGRAADDGPTPCSDYRRFQKAQLEELYGKEVAEAADKYLEFGFGYLTGTGLEKALAGAIEQAFLNLRGRKRPGQRAKRLSANSASRAMAAVNLLLRVQKLIAFYGTVGFRVTALDGAKPIHKPRGDRRLTHFAAIAGIDPKKLEEYKKRKERLPRESDLQKVLRDCLKAVGVPALTSPDDLADEMEEWRARWTFDMNSRHARVNVRESKFDFPGTFRHWLRRISPTEAGAVAAVDILAERDSDHEGCPDVYEAYVTATAELDASQPPSIGTVISALERNLLDPVSEVTAGLFQSLNTPSASDTLVITYHVPKRARPAQNLCAGLPAEWTGTVEGSATGRELYRGVTETWTASITFTRSGPPAAEGEDGWTRHPATGGTVSYSISGSDTNGCTYSGSGSAPIDTTTGNGFLDIGADSTWYFAKASVSHPAYTVTVSCGAGSSSQRAGPIFTPTLLLTRAQPAAEPMTRGTTEISGNYTTEVGGIDFTSSWALQGQCTRKDGQAPPEQEPATCRR